jgi:ligand-binding sensor domain-containing protein
MHKILSIIVYLSFLGINTITVAQEPYYINFKDIDGLPSNVSYKIFQDKTGYIWIATNNGISRFNGYEFLNFDYEKDSLPDNVICHTNFTLVMLFKICSQRLKIFDP